MGESLLQKASTICLENLHNELCNVMGEIDVKVPNQKTRLADEDYVKCLTLAADVLREMADRATKGK